MRRLTLRKETIRRLGTTALRGVTGGITGACQVTSIDTCGMNRAPRSVGPECPPATVALYDPPR